MLCRLHIWIKYRPYASSIGSINSSNNDMEKPCTAFTPTWVPYLSTGSHVGCVRTSSPVGTAAPANAMSVHSSMFVFFRLRMSLIFEIIIFPFKSMAYSEFCFAANRVSSQKVSNWFRNSSDVTFRIKMGTRSLEVLHPLLHYKFGHQWQQDLILKRFK